MFASAYGELESPTSMLSPGAVEIGDVNSPTNQAINYAKQQSQQQQQQKPQKNNNNKSGNNSKRPSINTNNQQEQHGSESKQDVRSPIVVDDPTSPKQSHVFTFPVNKVNSKQDKPKSKKSKDKDADSNDSKQSSKQQQLVVPSHMRIPQLDNIEMRQFINQVVAPGFLLQCIIKRNKSGVVGSLYPSYEVYHEASGTLLMVGRKKAGNKTSNFEINMDKHYRASGYLGKARGNFSGSEYIIYDNGVNPKKLKDIDNGLRRAREELMIVRFDNNILGNCPRSLTSAMPQVELDESTGVVTRRMWKPLSQTASMMERFKRDPEHKDMTVLKNKEPVWNERLGAYALNFNGRARIPSVKNFQLIHPQQPDYIMMQYGKMDKDLFTLDIQFPLSPLQAFGVALAGVDSKLVCD